MNKNPSRWKFVLVVLLVAWALYEIYPPSGTNIVVAFNERAENKDVTFTNILIRVNELQRENPNGSFGNLIAAIGTNDIRSYFHSYNVDQDPNPTRAILNRLQKDAAGKIRLGLDLQGGTSFLVKMDTTNLQGERKRQALLQAAEVLRKRVDKFGVAEPVIQPSGTDRILIQLPGISEAAKESARNQIQKSAFLEFRMVHEQSRELIHDGITEPGYEVLKMKTRGRNGTQSFESFLVKKGSERGLTGKNIKNAMVTRDQFGRPEINFTLDSRGAQTFGQITRENIGHQLAIVLDGELYSAPVIQSAIETGSGVITGDFEVSDAFELANVLQNPLEAPVKIESESSVDPTLGKDTIRSGVSSAIYATIAVAGFMVLYYMFAGAVANVALITNIIILLGVMASVGSTLTLPGIAGVVLTIGMAVDANVLIFERIREELAKGKVLRSALAAGYDRAFRTILDSHVTTLISSIILIYFGIGPIKGFGVTLTIGVAASLFTALVVTRLIFDFLLAKGWLKSLRMLHLIKDTKIDFMRFARFTFVASTAIIVAGLLYGGLVRGKQMLSIDFAGGDSLKMRFAQKVEADKLREAITKMGIPDTQIQFQKDVTGNAETLRITTPFGSGEKVAAKLGQSFPAAKFETLGIEKVGPSIGEEILAGAVIACLLSMFGILLYVAFRYEFSFAVGAIVAVVHDILLTLGCYCLTGLFGEGRQFNATMVAAVLTIIGFSLNDKIVVFDRIREDLKLGVRGSFRDIINQALNQTLSRTIITSGTVFLATLALFIFGGGAINDFAFTFLVGVITGTYSSIYIASAFVLWWHKGERPKTATSVAIAPSPTGLVGAGAARKSA